jgi:hypothetical protein
VPFTTESSIGSQNNSTFFSTENKTETLSTSTPASHQNAESSFPDNSPIPALILPDYFYENYGSEISIIRESVEYVLETNYVNSTAINKTNMQGIPEQEILLSNNVTVPSSTKNSTLFPTESRTTSILPGTTSAAYLNAESSFESNSPIPALILPDYFLENYNSESATRKTVEYVLETNDNNSTGINKINMQGIPEQGILFSSSVTVPSSSKNSTLFPTETNDNSSNGIKKINLQSMPEQGILFSNNVTALFNPKKDNFSGRK